VVGIRGVGLELVGPKLVGPKLVALMEVLVIGVRENDVQVMVMLIVQMVIVQMLILQMVGVLVVEAVPVVVHVRTGSLIMRCVVKVNIVLQWLLWQGPVLVNVVQRDHVVLGRYVVRGFHLLDGWRRVRHDGDGRSGGGHGFRGWISRASGLGSGRRHEYRGWISRANGRRHECRDRIIRASGLGGGHINSWQKIGASFVRLFRDHAAALRLQGLFPSAELLARQRPGPAFAGDAGGVINVGRAHCSLPLSEDSIVSSGALCAGMSGALSPECHG
jgi:hypothetical protein